MPLRETSFVFFSEIHAKCVNTFVWADRRISLTVNLPILVITTRLEMVEVGPNVYVDSLEEN